MISSKLITKNQCSTESVGYWGFQDFWLESGSFTNISVANCERLDKKYLKIVLELPENNFEKNFGKTKIVDRFINDLQDKLRKFKLTKTADSKDALKIIMKVRIGTCWYNSKTI